MTKHKEKAKGKAKKSSQLVLRVEKHEKDAFIASCKAIDSSAGKEIRRFMREFLGERTSVGPEADIQTEAAVEVMAVEATALIASIDGTVEQLKAVKRAKSAKKVSEAK